MKRTLNLEKGAHRAPTRTAAELAARYGLPSAKHFGALLAVAKRRGLPMLQKQHACSAPRATRYSVVSADRWWREFGASLTSGGGKQ